MSGSQISGQPQPVVNMRLAYGVDGTAVYRPVNTATTTTTTSYQSPSVSVSEGSAAAAAGPTMIPINMNMGGNVSGSGNETSKRKRGRPRKYGPDGTMALGMIPPPPLPPPPVTITPSSTGGADFSSPPPTPTPTPTPAAASGSADFSSPPPATAAAAAAAVPPPPPSSGESAPSMKKARGRPLGSSSKKIRSDKLGSTVAGFLTHVIVAKAGEDLTSKILAISQLGPRAVCILSATGSISNVTLRQQAAYGSTVTYEGLFEILTLTGSFTSRDQRSRSGGLSVSLAGPDGRVFGGCVAGLLIAASPVQIIVGTFISDAPAPKVVSRSANHMEQSSAPAGASSPPSRGTQSESSGGPGSPLNQSAAACNNNNSLAWK